MDEFQSKFDEFSTKIIQLQYRRTNTEKTSILNALNALNSLNFKYGNVNQSNAKLLLNAACSLVPPEATDLAVRCCQLVVMLGREQKVKVEGKSRVELVGWILEALACSGGASKDRETVLEALEVVLRMGRGFDFLPNILSNAHFRLIAKDANHPDLALASLQCLDACIFVGTEDNNSGNANCKITKIPAGQRQQIFQDCYDIFTYHLLHHKNGNKNPTQLKILVACLRGLQNVILQDPELFRENLGVILGIVKSYMVYAIQDVPFTAPQAVMPATMAIPEPSYFTVEKRGGKILKQRKHKFIKTQVDAVNDKDGETATSDLNDSNLNEINWENVGGLRVPGVPTSDSDFSDSEGGNLAKVAKFSNKVRQASLGLFGDVIKMSEKKTMFSYWTSFVPENASMTKHDLISCIRNEQSVQGQVTALNSLLMLLVSSKLYLLQAETSSNMPFTPFSAIIGLTLVELHKCLLDVLKKTPSIFVRVHTFKCLGALIQASPYHKLQAGLLRQVVQTVRPFVHHKDHNIRAFALIIMGCVLQSEPTIPETLEMLLLKSEKTSKPLLLSTEEIQQRTDDNKQQEAAAAAAEDLEYVDFSSEDEDNDVTEEDELSFEPSELPWLLERCLHNLNSSKTPISDKLQSIQIVSQMCRNYFEALVVPHFGPIGHALDKMLDEKFVDFQLHAGRAVDSIGQAMNHNLDLTSRIPDKFAQFWIKFLGKSLTKLMQSDSATLRAIGCDCIGSIGPSIFAVLPRDKHILCATSLLACTHDPENNVKAAAIRSLGICVSYPPVRDDTGFVIDTSERILELLATQNMSLRTKASWALGNLSQTLVVCKGSQEWTDDFPDSLLLKLINEASRDNKKDSVRVKMNIVRALGSLLQVVPEESLKTDEFTRAVGKGLDVILGNCFGRVVSKVKWNACYALGSVLKNKSMYSADLNCQRKVFETLLNLVVNSQNFKVRINAAAALMAPPAREFYGDFFQDVWIGLAHALENAENISDPLEYNHKDNLVEQICLTLAYLVTLIAKEDLVMLADHVGGHFENVRHQMGKVWDKLLPEKSTIIFEASAHVEKLKSNAASFGAEQREALTGLSQIFNVRIC